MKALRNSWSPRLVRASAALAALGIPSAAAFAGPVFYLPNGQGGYNAYELETGAATLPNAFSTAAGRPFAGAETVGPGATFGHVTTIRNDAHNAVINNLRSINFGGNSVWIGLTDDPTLVPGASEAGNTSGNPLPPAGQEPVAGQRGFGYKWQSGEPLTYQNWNGGEPNNAGTGENGVELTGSGAWNDNGPPSQAGLTRQYIVEYNLNLPSKPGFMAGAPAAGNGTFGVTAVRNAGTLNNVKDLQAALRGGIGQRDSGSFATINFKDPEDAGGAGKFGQAGRATFPGDTAGAADEDFGIVANGIIRITQEADYTFGFSGDDGSILGADFKSKTGGGFAAGDTLQFDSPTGDSNTLGVTHLTPGDYPIQYMFFERGGGAFTELYAGQGVITDRADANLHLIGDVANGGLQLVAAPEPSTFGVLAIGAAGLLRRRRRA
jgi:hypothetical protein